MVKAKPPTKLEVLVGSVWRRKDPSGAWVTFEVISTSGNNIHGQRCAKGKTPSGKVITLNLCAMEIGDARFEHVHDDRVRRTGT